MLDGPGSTPPSQDGDKGYTVIKNFRTGSDDLILSKSLNYVLAARSVNAVNGLILTGVGVHLDSNSNRIYDSTDNLIGILEYGNASSLSGGNIAFGDTSFGGRIIYF